LGIGRGRKGKKRKDVTGEWMGMGAREREKERV